MSNLPKNTAKDVAKDIVKDIDQVAVVVDWLDACRRHELGPLLDLYASDASLECDCDGANTYAGRAALESYWRPRLEAFSPNAFGLEEITPSADGVMLDYLNCEGMLVRIAFTFDASGKILHTRCGRFAPAAALDGVGVPHRAW
ncbi:nuclear transport factor 2 family protein [Bradyrhizobium sp. JYMT SZCCT0180]|nr:nuclear transport factor 2 family protein [Bradyrhizobium sp. JYMT SZCCT0180]